MKTLKGKSLIIVILLVFVTVFVFGIVYSNYVSAQISDNKQVNIQKYNNEVILLGVEANLDPATLGNNTYIVTFEYNHDTYKIYTNKDYFFTETIEGNQLNALIYSAVKHHADKEKLVSNTAYLVSYDENSRILVISATGHNGDPITATIVLNSSLNQVQSFTIISNETYDSQYNKDYTGGASPTVENQMLQQYIDNSPTIDTIAGASEGTSVAMNALITLLDQFIDSLQGGN